MQSAESDYVTWAEVLRGRYAASVLLCCLGVWLHAADALVVTTMMPAIVAEIGGDRIVAWNFALYDTGSIVAGAATGLVALRFGIRAPMIAAALLFASGCMLSAAAPSMPVLLAGRVAQGLGGGGLVSLSFVAVTRIFPERMMPRAFAAMSVAWGASAFAGPLVGGVFVTYGSWRLGFVAFAAQAALLALWFRFGIGKGAAPGGTAGAAQLPVRRLALLCGAVLGVAYAGIAGSVVFMAISLALGVAALALFAWLDERSGADRLWPRRAFDLRHPTGAALVMILAMNIATMGLAAYGPLLMDLIHGTEPLVAGYIVAIISIGWTLSAVVVSGQPPRRDPVFIFVGMTLILSSVAGLCYAVAAGPLWLIAVYAAAEGVGYGMAWTFIVRRAGRLAVAGDGDRLTAALPTIGRLGYALGASTMGIFANAAGFDASASAAEAAGVARAIFLGSLPIAALGWLAMLRFVTFRGQGNV